MLDGKCIRPYVRFLHSANLYHLLLIGQKKKKMEQSYIQKEPTLHNLFITLLLGTQAESLLYPNKSVQ